MYYLSPFQSKWRNDPFPSFLTRRINKLSSKSVVAAQYDLKLNAIEEVQSSLKLKNIYAGQWDLKLFLNTTHYRYIFIHS